MSFSLSLHLPDPLSSGTTSLPGRLCLMVEKALSDRVRPTSSALQPAAAGTSQKSPRPFGLTVVGRALVISSLQAAVGHHGALESRRVALPRRSGHCYRRWRERQAQGMTGSTEYPILPPRPTFRPPLCWETDFYGLYHQISLLCLFFFFFLQLY